MKAQRTWLISTLLIFGLAGSGCAPSRTVYERPAPVQTKSCYEESKVFGREFEYPCTERRKAKIASAVCDLMGAAAYSLVATNRRIGPTTPENLFVNAGVDQLPTMKVLYQTLGEEYVQAYINDIADMSVYIAQRNITDLVTYPNQRFDSCLATFNYVA